ncbi:MAG: excinuclease ABC subunit UvrA [Prevotellaceae bacterium]|nr:excinuclease ABC subunit UvrA [Candidatus Minthosoma caballi]
MKGKNNLKDYISIKGARVNNLKNIDVQIPHDKLVVITGVSGSGKSSLAFDTLYAEGQRRYVESLSTYARQFLGRLHKPECDFIEGISPAIAIEQKVTSRNPRSTVGTSTEIYDYLRMLFARIGRTYSPVSGQEVKKHTTDDIVDCMLSHTEGTRFVVMTPLIARNGRSIKEQLEIDYKTGFLRIEVDGEIVKIADYLASNEGEKTKDIKLVIDRLKVSNDKATISRLVDSAQTALYEGDGVCILQFSDESKPQTFSLKFEADGIEFEEPTDQMFSFNSPVGACPECEGYSKVIGIDESLVIPNTELSVQEGCVVCWKGDKMGEWKNEFVRRADKYGFPVFTPYYKLTQEQKDILWHGVEEINEWGNRSICIDAFFDMLKENQYKIQYRVMLARYRGKTICPVCHGKRLKKEAEYVKIAGKSITELCEIPVNELHEWFRTLKVSETETKVAKRLLVEIKSRLQFLVDVGLSYLTLSRMSNTLSGGESQRINLATSLGSSLVGSMYILDEPSIGLHSRDTQRLIYVLRKLQQLGNTVVVVEHDEEIMRAADYIIDIGPDAGRLGGEIVYQGNPKDEKELAKIKKDLKLKSHTLDYLLGTETIEIPSSRRPWNNYILIKNARENNLKGLDVKIPLNVMTCVTGVSGSGKSTLIRSILYRGLKRILEVSSEKPGQFSGFEGDVDMIKHVDFVDQNPIGTSSRSNPVTYIGAWDEIRKLFANQQLSKQLGYTAAFFSFNTDGGRCEECKGEGTVTVEMQFMNDIVLECESCHGKRFKSDILDVKFEGKSAYDVLNMTINQAVEFFTEHNQKRVINKLKPLQDVGLGYIKLGQTSSTLSGGENQRIKLAYYLSQERATPTMFIFDEPTTGLHFHDIKKLLAAFNALISRGHTIVIIEHNMDIIKCADHVIDLGPEGGKAGGNLVAEGTPEVISKCAYSYTGQYLQDKFISQP